MITRLEQLHDRIESTHAAAESEPVLSAFEGSDVALQCLTSWILSAGVLIAAIPADAFLGIGRGLVQRSHDCARGWIRSLARMNSPGAETEGGVVVEDSGHGVFGFGPKIIRVRRAPILELQPGAGQWD
jgi:hypothetical protein